LKSNESAVSLNASNVKNVPVASNQSAVNNANISKDSKEKKDTASSVRSVPTRKSNDTRKRASKMQKDSINEESLADEPALFEIFSPGDYVDG